MQLVQTQTMNYAELKPAIRYGNFNAYEIDTTPGAICWAAPPLVVDNYREWLRCQYETNRDFSDRMTTTSMALRRESLLAFSGPYVGELKAALVKLGQYKKPAKKRKKGLR